MAQIAGISGFAGAFSVAFSCAGAFTFAVAGADASMLVHYVAFFALRAEMVVGAADFERVHAEKLPQVRPLVRRRHPPPGLQVFLPLVMVDVALQ